MATLAATDIVVTHGSITVLDGVSIAITEGRRIGLVGPNGAGKSTLLRVLNHEITPDKGRVAAAPPTLSIGHLAQETTAPAGETVRQAISRRTGVTAATEALESAADALAAGGGDDAYAAALDHYLGLGAPDLDARLGEVCDDIGLPASTLDVAITSLSGGQRARVGLAAILLSRFDVFLLDEPTNDLDFAGLARLEQFVGGLTTGAVIVSHDRRFLDRTVTDVVELDAHSHRASAFGGGWQAYLDARRVQADHDRARYEEYVSTRGDLVDRIQTQKQWAAVGVRKATSKPKDNDKAQRDFRINNTEKLAGKVKISEKRLARLDAVDKPWEPWELEMSFGAGGRSGDVVASLAGAVVRRGDWTLGPLDLTIGWADRVAITGPNGAGKSTLIGALLGLVPLAAGTGFVGPSVIAGSLDQGRGVFGDARLLDGFVAASGLTVGDARSLLAKFGLGATHVGRSVPTLSPGERTRAVLALLMATSVNCLVLDEPTNHLDLPAIEELERALDRYEGTLLLVTHDRELLDRVAVTRTVAIDSDGTVTTTDV